MITGQPRVGQTLTVLPGTWDEGVTLTYVWKANGSRLISSRGPTIVLPAPVAGQRITVSITATRRGYDTVTRTSADTEPVAVGTLSSAVPKILGTARVGETLTASTGSWTPGTTFTFEWLADGIVVGKNSTLQLTTAQLGKHLTLRVTGSRSGYSPSTQARTLATSVGEGALDAPSPTIDGAVAVGSTLTASTGTWTPGTVLKIRWMSNGQPIEGATASTYTLPAARLGEVITVKITGSLSGYRDSTRYSGGTAPVAYGALMASAPVIVGNPVVGSTLSVKTGTWTPGTSLKYYWFADGKIISGATGSQLTLSAAQLRKTITVKVMGSREGYLGVTKASTSTPPVGAGTLIAPTPTIVGSPVIGQSLAGKVGTWTPGTVLSRQWLADGEPIPSAISPTLTITPDLRGKRITFQVIGWKVGYVTESRSSAASAAVSG
ncbi:hypothetical protein ACFXQA_09160 [Microbacterium sp. P07]|uniref:hypothetical protein n=1 Tax=Microbacterium sp. P07 TaxID=3366952 RepID=UPI00374766AA